MENLSASVPLVTMAGICKSFGSNRVLNKVNFEVRPGEVHALLGENGAGKSTLMKILLGVHAADEGEILFLGETLVSGSTRSRLDAGVAMIFQELSLVPAMSVADNIFLGREPYSAMGMINKRKIREDTARLIAERGFALDPLVRIENLPFAARQQVEILKALSRGASVIIMDEPTSSLTTREERLLHETIFRLRDQGIGIVFISHRMSEIFLLADRLSIIKDGVMQGPFAIDDISSADVARMMSRNGDRSAVESVARPPATVAPESVLEVRNLRTGRKLRDISFTLHAGEIVGIAGLVGSGRTTLAQAIFGSLGDTAGEVLLRGRDIARLRSAERIDAGIAMVPEDRRAQGLIAEHSVSSNMALPNLADLMGQFPGVVSQRRQGALYMDYRTALRIASTHAGQPVTELSGGNQQKVVFAKWLAGKPKLLILDEPTSGVDINAKAEMRALIRKAAADGLAVLLITSELDELSEQADRLLYMIDGRLAPIDAHPRGESEIRQILQEATEAMEPT